MKIDSNAYHYIEKTFGKQIAIKYKEFVEITPIDYIRINRLKADFSSLQKTLYSKYSIEIQQIQNFPDAAKVNKDPENLIGKTLEHALGYYYIQSLSSMLPAYLLNPLKQNKVLDLCAAPGSKTTQLSEMMNNEGTLIANEIDINRIKSLVFNIDRLNLLNVGVINNKGEILSKIYDNYFDKILVDVPCSSLGIIQKRNEVTDWWTEEHSERLHQIQLKLLIAAIRMAKVGGEIIYSTCTVSIQENESVIDKVLKNYPVELKKIEIPFPAHLGVSKFKSNVFDNQIKNTIRIFPFDINSDGFFIAKLLKNGPTEPLAKLDIQKHPIKFINYKNKQIIKPLLELSDYFGIDFNFFSNFNFLIKSSDIFITDVNWFDNNLEIFNRIGIKFGSFDTNEKISLHSNGAQLLGDLVSEKIYQVKDLETLEKFIAGSKFDVNDNLDFGQYIVRYKNYILGTAINTKDGFKSRFPKSKRSQKLILR